MFFVMGFALSTTLIPIALNLTSPISDSKNFWRGFVVGVDFILMAPWIVIPLLGWAGGLNPILKRLGVMPDRSAFRPYAIAGVSGIAFTGVLALGFTVVLLVLN
jgi:hypothetical protein